MPRWLTRTIKIVFCVAWTVVAAEFYLRIFIPVPILPRYIQASSFGIRENIPNRTYTHVTPEYVVELRTSSQGFRDDREFSPVTPPDTARIIVLGDSFAIGFGVNYEDSVPALLEANLTEALNRPIEVINMGVSGFGTAEELIMLEKLGWQYNPDIVIVYWHATDPVDNIRSNLFKLKDGKIVPVDDQYLPAVEMRQFLYSFPAYRWIAGHSHLYSWTREFAAVRVKGILSKLHQREQVKPIVEDKGERVDPGVRLSLALLDEMQRRIQAHGANMIILEIPGRPYFDRSRFQKPDRDTYFPTFPLDVAQSMGLKFDIVDPTSEFLGQKGEKIYWEKSHGHWTPLGTSCVAKALAERIVSQDLLAKRQPGKTLPKPKD